MKHYEILYLFPAKYTEEELQPLVERVQSLLKKYAAQITFNQLLGRRKLAYPIKQVHNGYYYVAEFDLEPNNLQLIENELRLSPEVLRHQIISKEVVATELAPELTAELAAMPKPEAIPNRLTEPIVTNVNINIDELDKKLEEILEEKVT